MCTVLYRILVQYSTQSVNINNNKYLLASVYERHNEKSLIPPLITLLLLLFFAHKRQYLASVYERCIAFAFKEV